MNERIDALLAEARQELFSAQTEPQVEAARVKYLGKNRKRKRHLRHSQVLARRDEKHLKKALPYGLPK